MRSVALDLGGRITFCEVASGEVVGRKTVKAFDRLEDVLGPGRPRRGWPSRPAVSMMNPAR